MSSLNKILREKLTEQNCVGVQVRSISDEAQLARMTLAHMLWEDQFYVNRQSSADVIRTLVGKVNPAYTATLAEKARKEFKLRHVPLLLTRELARRGSLKADTLANVIQRPDEMGEFLSIYWEENKNAPIPNQAKKGLAKAFKKFNEYSLAKWDKNSAGISVRDVMFLTHVKPDQGQEDLYKRIANKELKTPDTWEVALSAGADKGETFRRLMDEGKLGALAFLRNLRNMLSAGVPEGEIRAYAKSLDVSKVLPFRYIAAARHAPRLEDMLEEMMFRSLANTPKLPGRTILVVDTSGSMSSEVGGKSEITRLDAAAALAMMAREVCEEVAIYATAGDDYRRRHATVLCPPRRGFALANYITKEARHQIGGGGIFLIQVMDWIASQEGSNKIDRVLVFTDEQDCDAGRDPATAKLLCKGKNYIMNIAAYKNGINSSRWETISGFSEVVLEYIRLSEQL